MVMPDMSLKNILLTLPFTDEQLSKETNIQIEDIKKIKEGNYNKNDPEVYVITSYLDKMCVKLIEHMVYSDDFPIRMEMGDLPMTPRLISDEWKNTLEYRINHRD